MRVAVITDSGSAMSMETAKEKGIYLIPLQVIDEEISYQDGVDISRSEIYDRLRNNHTPKTSMPILSVVHNTIRKIIDDGYEAVLSVPLSCGLSSTFNSIEISCKEKGIPVTTLENYTTCNLQGYLALLAKQMLDEGKSLEDTVMILNQLVTTSGTLILPNDLQHLKRGGRLTPLAAAAASLLKIKPVLKLSADTNGKIDVFGKVRTYKKAIAFAVDDIIDHMAGHAGKVYVIHSDCLDKAEEIKAELLHRNNQLDIEIDFIYPVISAHTGLDCIAIQYIEKC